MKTYMSATYTGTNPAFAFGVKYPELLVTHYFLGNKVRVQTCHGFDHPNKPNAEIVYDDATAYARDWKVDKVWRTLEQKPTQRKAKHEDA